MQRDKERAAAERARNRRARHRKLAAAKSGEAVEEEEEEEKEEERLWMIKKMIGNQRGCRHPALGDLRLTQQIERRDDEDDRRRRLRKAITTTMPSGNWKIALAVEAAVDLAWLDHALRYCEPLGQCLIDRRDGQEAALCHARAAENAERGIKRLSAMARWTTRRLVDHVGSSGRL